MEKLDIHQKSGKWKSEKDLETKEFDFILGDFNVLLDVKKSVVQPLVFDYHNFNKNKELLFKKDQMKKVFAECKPLKNFREADISILTVV